MNTFLTDLQEIREQAVQAKEQAAKIEERMDSMICKIDHFLNTHGNEDIIVYLRNNKCSYAQIADVTGLGVSTVMHKVKKYEKTGQITYKKG